MQLARSLLEYLIYGVSDPVALEFDEGPRRFTQDSPVLPDVWIQYGEQPREALELLLTPRFGTSAGEVSRLLREGVEGMRKARDSPDIAYNQTYVAAKLHFDELVRIVLPMTSWWREHVEKEIQRLTLSQGDLGLYVRENRDKLGKAIDNFGKERETETDERPISTDLLWMVRLVGTVAWARAQSEEVVHKKPPTPEQMIDALADLVGNMPPPAMEDDPRVWQVNINRKARVAVQRSTLAIKADAARLLFKVHCDELAWAIIDSGIDARHPAFWNWRGRPQDDDREDIGRAKEELEELRDKELSSRDIRRLWPLVTRVRATYDFTRARELLNPERLGADEGKWPDFVQTTVNSADDKETLREMARELGNRLGKGRPVDWSLAEPFLKIPHREGDYLPPRSEHGTHVGGILAADWPYEGMEGVCPDIELYDMRVLKHGAHNDEFAVLAALQFLTHLNDQKDLYRVHGVNISLAIRHDVANFACGRTPVCDECERAVASGVVVVAAAGNEGYLQYVVSDVTGERTTEGYHTVSITDPGNADKVITVGSTHRYQPHTYGVSYFSSRGPTGDGRIKPDLVAPGEKVEAPIPNADKRVKDGTSMAAPHVSGAAALLLARHMELIGQPERVKEVLCRTATDLGRERYFQGAGMLDVLRAIQSV